MVKNPAKRKKKNKPTSKKYKFYTIEGDTVKRGKTCPRCGPGIFLADAGNRVYCGRCHYTEFVTKAAEKPAEPKAEKAEEPKAEEKPAEKSTEKPIEKNIS